MMDTRTGEYALLDWSEFEKKVAAPPEPHQVLVTGTIEEIETLSRAIRRTSAEDEARRARRKAQKDARRRNRG